MTVGIVPILDVRRSGREFCQEGALRESCGKSGGAVGRRGSGVTWLDPCVNGGEKNTES